MNFTESIAILNAIKERIENTDNISVDDLDKLLAETLEALGRSDDPEAAHYIADRLLVNVLRYRLGMLRTSKAFEKMVKMYA